MRYCYPQAIGPDEHSVPSRLSNLGYALTLIFIFPLSVVACGKPSEDQATVVQLKLPTIFSAETSVSTRTSTPTATNTPLPPTSTPTSTPGLESTLLSERDGAIMVYVPAGEFTMGSDPETDPSITTTPSM